jgi:hypothetical protein
MPGSYKGSNASGYATTYDRLRVISAASAVLFPVYNYVNTDYHQKGQHNAMSAYVAFESDGMIWGYGGCNYEQFARSAHYESAFWNQAFLVNPDLCPLGKFGYDARCRTWYTNTKKGALESGDVISFGPPYLFAEIQDVGISAAAPLIDPHTGEFIGISFIEFRATEFFQSLVRTRSDFHFIIAPEAQADEDAIVGPGHAIGDPPAAISDVVLPHDSINSTNRAFFSDILKDMKAGLKGEKWFQRTTSEGSEENIFLSYLPVHARILKPVQPDDYSRGANASRVLIYSIGVARSEETMRLPFKAVEDKMNERLHKIMIVYLSCVAIITLLCVLLTSAVSPCLLFD